MKKNCPDAISTRSNLEWNRNSLLSDLRKVGGANSPESKGSKGRTVLKANGPRGERS